VAQVQLIGLPGQAAVPGQDPAKASRSVLLNTGVTGTRAADEIVVAIRHLRGLRLRPRKLGQPRPQQDDETLTVSPSPK
jgi:hypothetical protein